MKSLIAPVLVTLAAAGFSARSITTTTDLTFPFCMI